MNEHKSCSECEGQKHQHHWIENLNTDGTPYVECKHCEAEIEMAEETTFIETSQGSHTFYFVCEGCGEEGVLNVQVDRVYERVHCPEGCGHVYIPWNDPIKNEPALMCVIKTDARLIAIDNVTGRL